jgi:four helix bundle protein
LEYLIIFVLNFLSNKLKKTIMYDFWEENKRRTKEYALRIIKLYRALPKDDKAAQIIGNQLLRSATSVAANYRAACRGRSQAERYSKLCIVVEAADESELWLEILVDSGIFPLEKVQSLL